MARGGADPCGTIVLIGSMTLYGPLTAQDFLRLLQKVADEPPDRAFFDAVLDALIDAMETERGFLVKIRGDSGCGGRVWGGPHVVTARNFESAAVPRPRECLSHHAIREALQSPDRYHHTNGASGDRRYRTDELRDGGRRPISILVVVLPQSDTDDTDEDTVLYFDHRFRAIDFNEHRRCEIDHWVALLRLGLTLRDQRAELKRRARMAGLQAKRKTSDSPSPDEYTMRAPVESREFHGLWSSSQMMVELFDTVDRLAASDIPVLISGETGTGKTLLAYAFHRSSQRSGMPLLAVNCGALPDDLLESELFGHVRGAFTGAESDRQGLVAEAQGGTLFLDEVGDMSTNVQSKLLRFLEDGRFRPLGAKDEIQGDVRLISSTQFDLERQVERGCFRADLYYRLRGLRVEIPPLRQRREDIMGLTRHFFEKFSGELGVQTPTLTEGARRWLFRSPWFGNVRELENVCRQVTALGHTVVERSHLISPLSGTAPYSRHTARDIGSVVAAAEREAIQQALGESRGNKSRAAELLGITRKSLYRRLEKYGLSKSESTTLEKPK